MCPFVLQCEESTMLLNGSSAVALGDSKLAGIRSISGPFQKHYNVPDTKQNETKQNKKTVSEKLAGDGATMGNMVNSLVFLSLELFSKSLLDYIFCKSKGAFYSGWVRSAVC